MLGNVRAALAQTHGTYGLLSTVATRLTNWSRRNGSPVIMRGPGDVCGPDLGALVQHVTQVVHLDDGEVATIDARLRNHDTR